MSENYIDDKLREFEGYLESFKRDTVRGVYVIRIGLPNNWVMSETYKIGYKIISESETGKLIEIYPKNDNVKIDELFNFCSILFKNNKKILEKEQEFLEKMESFKSSLEEETKKFYDELKKMKDNAFKEDLDINDINTTPKINLNKKKVVRKKVVKKETNQNTSDEI